jgi:ketosteroid isomerase-like protein
MAHPNEELLRKAYEGFATGNMEPVTAAFDENIVWHSPGRSAISGDFEGRDAVMAFFGKVVELSGGTFVLSVHDVLANDEHGAGLIHATAKRGDASWEGNIVHVIHFTGGRVTEVWVHEQDQYTTDEFWA